MKIKSAFFIVIQISLISFLSFGLVYFFAFTQVKKEYSSLHFIPDDALLVTRIDSKEIGKDLLKEFISKDFFSKLPKTKQEGKVLDLSFIDFNYPLYFFVQNLNKKQIIVATIQLSNPEAFLKSVNKSNQNSFGFTYNGKGYWIFNCSKNDSDSLKQKIISSKSNRWDGLLNSKNDIAFMSNFLDAKGIIAIHENSFQINASIRSLSMDTKNYKKLKTDGFNFTISNPERIIKDFGINYFPLITNSFSGIQSISINHKGYRAPFFPNLTALLQVDTSFNLQESISKINSSQIEFEDNKLYVAGAKFYVSKPQTDCFLFSFKENKSTLLPNTENIIESSGDLTQLVNFEDAPLMKMVLLSNSSISKIYSLIQKTDKYNLSMSKVNSSNRHSLTITIELKKPNSFFSEMLSMSI
jgi:hypothetical protein